MRTHERGELLGVFFDGLPVGCHVKGRDAIRFVTEHFDTCAPGVPCLSMLHWCEGEFELTDIPSSSVLCGSRFEIVARRGPWGGLWEAPTRWPALVVQVTCVVDEGVSVAFKTNGAPTEEVDADVPVVVEGV